MTQAQPQFQRPLLRIGSILFIAGMVIAIVSTAIHPSTEDPSNHPLVFAEYASDDSWIAVHIGQFAGGIMVFAGGFVALYRLCNQNQARLLSWPGILIPTGNTQLLRWCLNNRLRLVQQLTLMTIGLYNEPAGFYMPSILY
jgi:hypothetical protein